MSDFVTGLVEKFVGGSNQSQSERYTETETSSYGYGYGYGGDRPPPPPECPDPWRAHWHDRERCYYFVNEETSETVWEFEEVRRRTAGGGYERGYYEQSSTTYYDQRGGGYGGEQRAYEESRHGGGHGMLYGGLGAAAGLAAGAGLMYEGEKIHNEYDADKYRVENDVENFPDNAAQWTGHAVGEVENIPQDIEGGFDRFGNSVEQKWDDAKYDVEDAPENVAGWAGEKLGDFERFGDNVDAAYDQGRYEGRNDYDDY